MVYRHLNDGVLTVTVVISLEFCSSQSFSCHLHNLNHHFRAATSWMDDNLLLAVMEIVHKQVQQLLCVLVCYSYCTDVVTARLTTLYCSVHTVSSSNQSADMVC